MNETDDPARDWNLVEIFRITYNRLPDQRNDDVNEKTIRLFLEQYDSFDKLEQEKYFGLMVFAKIEIKKINKTEKEKQNE